LLRKDAAYDRIQFERRQHLPIVPGKDAYFARPEDVILYKMLYFKQGGSERHLRDIASMLRISGADIETRYVTEWAQQLGLREIWDAILRQTTDG
jgi:hypothetical protein